MTALHTLGILSTSFSWNEFLHMLSTCWLLFLHSVVQLIQNHLNWVEDGWLWRPGHLMQHSHTDCVLGNCPVEKHMIVPLRANQMRFCIRRDCVSLQNYIFYLNSVKHLFGPQFLRLVTIMTLTSAVEVTLDIHFLWRSS